MIRIDNITPRKNVVKYQTQSYIEPPIIEEVLEEINKIVSDSLYTTNNENLIVIKGVEFSEITLDSTKSKKITIKSLTQCLIKSDVGLIDEEWDELLLEKGACVQFQFVEGNWYILSSDGLKMS